jgi:hypothetical protein
MFERCTEKARRVVFFARFAASQYGSQSIETEHLLLGRMRENFPLMSNMIGYGISVDGIRSARRQCWHQSYPENAVDTDRTSRSVLRMTILLVPEGEEVEHLSRASHSIRSASVNQIHAPEQPFLADSPTSRRAYCLE